MIILRVCGFLIGIVSLSVLTARAGPESPSTLEAATGNLKPDQQIRIQNRDFQTLRGYFVRTTADSLYFGSSVASDIEANAISMSDIDRMWAHQSHGVGRGLLWGGGVLLLGGALTLGLGAATMDEAMGLTVLMGATVVIAGYAFYKGASGITEKMIYSSYLQ